MNYTSFFTDLIDAKCKLDAYSAIVKYYTDLSLRPEELNYVMNERILHAIIYQGIFRSLEDLNYLKSIGLNADIMDNIEVIKVKLSSEDKESKKLYYENQILFYENKQDYNDLIYKVFVKMLELEVPLYDNTNHIISENFGRILYKIQENRITIRTKNLFTGSNSYIVYGLPKVENINEINVDIGKLYFYVVSTGKYKEILRMLWLLDGGDEKEFEKDPYRIRIIKNSEKKECSEYKNTLIDDIMNDFYKMLTRSNLQQYAIKILNDCGALQDICYYLSYQSSFGSCYELKDKFNVVKDITYGNMTTLIESHKQIPIFWELRKFYTDEAILSYYNKEKNLNSSYRMCDRIVRWYELESIQALNCLNITALDIDVDENYISEHRLFTAFHTHNMTKDHIKFYGDALFQILVNNDLASINNRIVSQASLNNEYDFTKSSELLKGFTIRFVKDFEVTTKSFIKLIKNFKIENVQKLKITNGIKN